jgi:hypothetical protein
MTIAMKMASAFSRKRLRWDESIWAGDAFSVFKSLARLSLFSLKGTSPLTWQGSRQ